MKNEFLRHTLSTINYRFRKSIKYSHANFDNFTLGKGSRTPQQIVNHMYFVLSATIIFLKEEKLRKDLPEQLNLKLEIDRFNTALKTLDEVLDKTELPINYTKRLLQGPLADLLTHIGQIAFLSRLNDHPIEGEDFSSAAIQTGLLSP